MNFYISDLHFGHGNILKFDGRPWFNTQEMEEDLIARWNAKVSKSDHVFILGDFCWGLADMWRRILPKLNGFKHLIKGNHDLVKMPADIRKMFASVSDYKEVKDNGRLICMSHYPMLAYKHDSDPNTYMLYGHVHNTFEYRAMLAAIGAYKDLVFKETKGTFPYQGNLYNCWGGFFNWTPATLDEIIARGR